MERLETDQPVGQVGTIYLIHFDQKISHAGHYLGWTNDVSKRMERHRKGDGARLMRAVKQKGITYSVVRMWTGDRHLERKMKNNKKSSRLCPICSPTTFHMRFV